MRQLLKEKSSSLAFIKLFLQLPAWCDTERLCCRTDTGFQLALVSSLDMDTGNLCVGVHNGKLLFL